MIELPKPTSAGLHGSWAYQVDALARHLTARPALPITEAARDYPGIPDEVLEHIYAERKRRRNLLKEAS